MLVLSVPLRSWLARSVCVRAGNRRSCHEGGGQQRPARTSVPPPSPPSRTSPLNKRVIVMGLHATHEVCFGFLNVCGTSGKIAESQMSQIDRPKQRNNEENIFGVPCFHVLKNVFPQEPFPGALYYHRYCFLSGPRHQHVQAPESRRRAHLISKPRLSIRHEMMVAAQLSRRTACICDSRRFMHK